MIRLIAMVFAGLLAAFVASNVTAFFVARPDIASRVLIGPVIEEGARVAALALLFFRFDGRRFQRLDVLGFAVGFSIVGLIWHVAFNMSLSPPLPPVVTFLAPVATVALHAANSVVAVQYIERKRYMTALMVCLLVHALYNGYIVLAFAKLSALAQSIEVPLRAALLLVATYLFLPPRQQDIASGS